MEMWKYESGTNVVKLVGQGIPNWASSSRKSLYHDKIKQCSEISSIRGKRKTLLQLAPKLT